MPADFVITQGDVEPIFAQQISDSTGSPVDLTGCTAALQLRALTSTTPLTLTGQITIFDAPNGKLQWEPSTADTTLAGDYMGKWVITYMTGQTQSYPTDGYLWIRVEPNVTSEPLALVSLPEVKDYLNASGGNVDRTHDDKILGFINDVTPLIENAVGPVLLRTFEEWHDGGQYWVTLRRKPSYALGTTPVFQILGCDEYRGPIKYALSIITDPTAATIYSCMLDQRTGTLYRRTTGGGVIPFGAGAFGGAMPDAVHVVYQAGQRTVPGNIKRAALETIRWNYLSTMPTGTGSRSLADVDEYGAGPSAMVIPRSVMEWLAPNRRRPAIA
jgi:hypothetical protein